MTSSKRTAAPNPGRGETTHAGFNAAFLDDNRSEQIFAYHLQRLGINRVLDIGSHAGQFAGKLRSFGYDGVIYSVEPQRQVYGQLLQKARSDMRWVPLPRQGAGEEKRFAELNIAENSWSSSVLKVHPNHVQAEQTTRTVATERIYINKSGELLRPEVLSEIEALKIDVQGLEKQVIEGYLPFMPNIRLLLLELSLVECYRDAPDMFDLDRWLVNDFAFSRISLEPSYYDDVRGIVQQYDGIYHKPDAQPRRTPLGLRELSVVTSIGGSMKRSGKNGEEIGAQWFKVCSRSWAGVSNRIFSVSEQAPHHEGVAWLRTVARPSITEILQTAAQESEGPILLTNADISLTGGIKQILPSLDPFTLYYGARFDGVGSLLPDGEIEITGNGYYPWGFDFFILPSALVKFITREGVIPEDFKIGRPWWDYLLPIIAMAHGFPIKKLESPGPLAVHLKHEEKFSRDLWLDSGRKFIALIQELLADPDLAAKSFLSELLEVTGSEKERLDALSNMLCNELP